MARPRKGDKDIYRICPYPLFWSDAAGLQIGSNYTDSVTGVVSSNSTLDDQGRPEITTDTDNGQTRTETTTYTPQDDLAKETFSSAGNSSVGYSYYPTTGFGSTGTADGLQTMTEPRKGGTKKRG